MCGILASDAISGRLAGIFKKFMFNSQYLFAHFSILDKQHSSVKDKVIYLFIFSVWRLINFGMFTSNQQKS